MSNFREWSNKASQIEKKYEDNKLIIITELEKIKHKSFPEEILVMLFLLKKIVVSQEILYRNLVNGSNVYFTSIAKNSSSGEIKNIVQMLTGIRENAINMLKIMGEEKNSLSKLDTYFNKIKRTTSLAKLEVGLFSKHVSSKKLKKVTQDKFLNENDAEIIHSICDFVLSRYQLELKERISAKSKMKHVIGKLKYYLGQMQDGKSVQNTAKIVYLSAYAAYGLISIISPELQNEIYPVFSGVTDVARRLGFPGMG